MTPPPPPFPPYHASLYSCQLERRRGWGRRRSVHNFAFTNIHQIALGYVITYEIHQDENTIAPPPPPKKKQPQNQQTTTKNTPQTRSPPPPPPPKRGKTFYSLFVLRRSFITAICSRIVNNSNMLTNMLMPAPPKVTDTTTHSKRTLSRFRCRIEKN